MKRFIVDCLFAEKPCLSLIVALFSLFTLTLTLAPLAFAQGFGPIPPGGCPAGYTEGIGQCMSVGLGKISPPPGAVPDVGTNPSVFVAALVKNSLALLLIVSFVIALIWMILNGLRFILAQGDEKTVASAWTQIYWTLIGMVIIMGSFAIIKMVETFFGVSVLSGDLKLPHL